jgi:hypothetical protein
VFYPAAVVAVAIIVTIILLIFVIPQFESLFKGFGADLPAFTQMVINLSRFVQAQGWWMLIVAGGAGWTFFYFKKRSRPMRQFLDRMMLKAPIIGPIMVKAAIARYARTLSTMFAAGVPLVEALTSVAGATGNIVFEDATLRIRDEVSTGQRLQRSMETTGLFPNMVIQMIAVGEESGSLDQMASKVADFYEADVDRVTDHAIRTLVARGGPLVAILWGRDAQSLAPLLGDVPRIESAHPSPLSASRGFFGSRPFSRANELLVAQGGAPVVWAFPDCGRSARMPLRCASAVPASSARNLARVAWRHARGGIPGAPRAAQAPAQVGVP